MSRRSIRTALAGALVCLGLLAAPAGAAVVLDDGHVDYGARMIGGGLQSQVKDGTTGSVVWREPADVLFVLVPEARTTIPAGSKIGFLGPPGSTFWMIPQVQQSGVLWAGWNTEEIGPSQVSGQVNWRLDAVEGPGRVAVFQTGAFGQPDVIFDSADGLPDARSIPLGTHAHGNWAFGAPGEYRLTFTMSAERATGGITSDAETLAVRVEEGSANPGPDPGEEPRGGGKGGDGQAQGEAAEPRLRLAAARLRGRRLLVSVKLNHPGRIAVAVHRAGRTVARTPARWVGLGSGRLRFRLQKDLEPGRYRVVATARFGSSRLRETIALRVGRRG